MFEKCLSRNETLIYNFAYRLMGDRKGAVKLICNSLKGCADNCKGCDCPRAGILSQICCEYVDNWKNYLRYSPKYRSIVEECICRLPPREKIVLVLHDVLKLSSEEIAEITGFSKVFLRGLLNKARIDLKDKLA